MAAYRRAEVDIDFPLDAVGTDLAALMTIAIGGVYSIKGLSGIRIVGLQLPPAFGQAHPGPQFGTPGTRRLTGVYDRPIIGSIVKPALGLRPPETAALVEELVEADVDFIKDDEKLMSPAYSSLPDRVAAIMPIILDHEQKTGKKVMYAFNISGDDPEQMLRDHDIVAEAGGNAAVICINAVGFGGLKFLRKRSRLALHAHRAGLGHPHPPSRARHGFFGLPAVLAPARHRSVPDQRHPREILGARRELRALASRPSPRRCSRPPIAPCRSSARASGAARRRTPIARTGRTTDLLYLCGGGIVSHPGGPAAGVRAVRQSWEAAVAGIPLDVYARDHRELAQSLEKFGASDAAA